MNICIHLYYSGIVNILKKYYKIQIYIFFFLLYTQ